MPLCLCVSIFDYLFYFLFQFIPHFPGKFRSRFAAHEGALRDVDGELLLLGEGKALPEGVLLLVLARLPVVLRPEEAAHLGGDGGVHGATPVVDGGVGHTGEDSHLPVAGRIFNASGEVVPAGKQRSVLGVGTASSAALPSGLLPRVETVVGKAPLAEVLLDVPFGDVAGKDGHLAAHQVVQLLSALVDAAVEFLDVHN